ncbi:hypothetical protein ACIBM3_31355 [Rhodococcus erythropolis]|uniref:hypothetical protein n=1 Tax=Rhodococcus erythropolis TaxID=1833 RepID=UPI0037A8C1E6
MTTVEGRTPQQRPLRAAARRRVDNLELNHAIYSASRDQKLSQRQVNAVTDLSTISIQWILARYSDDPSLLERTVSVEQIRTRQPPTRRAVRVLLDMEPQVRVPNHVVDLVPLLVELKRWVWVGSWAGRSAHRPCDVSARPRVASLVGASMRATSLESRTSRESRIDLRAFANAVDLDGSSSSVEVSGGVVETSSDAETDAMRNCASARRCVPG